MAVTIVIPHVVGTRLTVSERMGDPETVLVHVIRRFHYESARSGCRASRTRSRAG